MVKYRIKINELNNGDKEYEPQVSSGVKMFGVTLNFGWFSDWDSIGKNGYVILYIQCFKTTEEALDCIKKHKLQSKISLAKEVKKTTYKIV